METMQQQQQAMHHQMMQQILQAQQNPPQQPLMQLQLQSLNPHRAYFQFQKMNPPDFMGALDDVKAQYLVNTMEKIFRIFLYIDE